MADITFRNYTNVWGITEDYHKVRNFFIERGYCEFTYARWDWMITHSCLEKNNIGKIGLWEDNGKIVALATFDCQLGGTYLITLPEYEYIKTEMVLYAEKNMNINEKFSLVIADSDICFQNIAAGMGFVATRDREFDAAFYPEETSSKYTLPDGFFITDMKQTFDLYQYGRVLWKGFNHELNGEGLFDLTSEIKKELETGMLRSNVNLNLKIAAVTPSGNFAAYCGMWYDENAEYAVIEPVATDPDYRKMGLGKAVVLEGIKRVSELGAKIVIVGSSQQFYYNIGLRPYNTSTKWKKAIVQN